MVLVGCSFEIRLWGNETRGYGSIGDAMKLNSVDAITTTIQLGNFGLSQAGDMHKAEGLCSQSGSGYC
uniref:Lipoprotein n=1 Tax=Ascaris lumbricoides TaxID=6252 RepID=A0A0M3IH90_ASCLU